MSASASATPSAPEQAPGGGPEPERAFVFAPTLRIARVIWRILPMIGLAVAVWFVAWLFEASPATMHQIVVGAVGLLAWSVLAAVIREVLSPDRPWLRALPVDDRRAHRLDVALRSVLFFTVASTYGIWLVHMNDWNAGVADLLRVLRNVVIAISAAIVLGTTGVFRWLRARTGDSVAAVLARFVANVAFPASILVSLVFAVARGLGYHPLAAWVLKAATATVLKMLLALLVYRALRRVLYRTVRFYVAERGPIALGPGEVLDTNPYGLGAVRILTGLAKIALVILTFLWSLQSWSLSPEAVRTFLEHDVLGGGAVTWGDLVEGLWRVFITLAVGWLLRSILIYFVFPRSQASVGARYAILAVLRYVIVGLAIVFALVAFGIDASSLGWFFGAAGIGLAFGLQDIISNFVSGLIMLIERPMRVGDLVQVGATMGNVEEIRMRGTVLRTFDNTTVLIPNSQMLGERVTNLTHDLAHSRITVDLLVPHEAEPEAVEAILTGAAAAHPEVLEEPAPSVWFVEFSASSFDFRLVCFTAQLRSRIMIASQLRHDIVRRLRAAGIEIPHPQTDVHLRTGGAPSP